MVNYITYDDEQLRAFVNENEEAVRDMLHDYNYLNPGKEIKVDFETISIAEFISLHNKLTMAKEPEDYGDLYGFLDDIQVEEEGYTFDSNLCHYFLVNNITDFFVGAFSKLHCEEDKKHLQPKAQKMFKEMIAKGANKEMIRLRLLQAEQNKKRYIRGLEKDKKLDGVSSQKEELKENVSLQQQLDLIRSPYDRLFEVSAEIENLKREYNKLNGKVNFTPDETKRFDAIQEEIERKQDWIAREMKKYDPRIVLDVINDKMACARVEEEIKQEQKGVVIQEGSVRMKSDSEAQLMNDLKAVKRQVLADIKFLEQNNNYSV